MGTDLYMNPPKPVYDTEIIYDVNGSLREKVTDRVDALIQARKTFDLTPVNEGYRLSVHTGRYV